MKTILSQRLDRISTVQLPWKKTFLGFPLSRHQVSEALEKLQHLRNLREVRIVEVGDQSWSKSWIYHDGNLLLNQAVQKTSARVVFGHRVVRDGPVSRPGPESRSTFHVLKSDSDGIYQPRLD